VAGCVQVSGERLFYLDACRAAFVLLGIVLHALLPFIPEPWIVECPRQSRSLVHIYNLIHAFRMPAFFILSGFFAALVLSKRDGLTWAKSRATRLGVPLLFGMMFIVPLQSIALSLGDHLSEPRARSILAAAIERHAGFGFHLVSHLWFILDLLLISLAVAAAYALVGERRIAAIGRAIGDALARHKLLLASVATGGLAAYAVVVERVAHGRLGNVIAVGGSYPMCHVLDAARIAHYAPYFGLGLLLFYSKPLLSSFVQLSLLTWMMAIAVTGSLLVLLARPQTPAWQETALSVPTAILLTQISMNVASRLITRHNRLVQWLSHGSYTIYIVHQPIIVLIVVLSIPLGLPAIGGFLLVLSLTTILSAVIYRVTRDNAMATFLLNGVKLPQTER
jgi:glucans biosynthesis protein C